MDNEDISNNRTSFSGAGGRPPKYETPEEMQEAISGYFRGGMNKRKIVVGKGDDRRVEEIPIPTITGLVLYLGFADRHSFYDYEDKPEFSHTIKRARTFIELEYEEILQTTGNTGAIFALKNFGWQDRSELAVSSNDQKLEDKIKDFLDDGDNRPDNLPDDSEETTTETDTEA